MNPYYEMGHDAYFDRKDVRRELLDLDLDEEDARQYMLGYMKAYEED